MGFVLMGALPGWAAVVGGIGWLGRSGHYRLIYDFAEVIGPASLALLVFLATRPSKERRPWTGVPWDAAWWEFFLFGGWVGVASGPIAVAFLGTIVVLPVLVPFKVFREYVFGASSSLASAVAAVPVVGASVGFFFALLYLLLILHGRGNLRSGGQLIYTGERGKGWPPFGELFHFSLSTMLGVGTPYEPQGWCRWLVMAQATLTKLIEIVLVGIGVTLILERTKH